MILMIDSTKPLSTADLVDLIDKRKQQLRPKRINKI